MECIIMTNSDEDFMTIYPPVPSQDWQNNRLFDEVTALRAALAERETENKYLRKQIEDLTNRLNWFESKNNPASTPQKSSIKKSFFDLNVTQEKTPEEMFELGKKYYESHDYVKAAKW